MTLQEFCDQIIRLPASAADRVLEPAILALERELSHYK